MRTTILVMAVALLLGTGCDKKRYYWADVPYCAAGEGAMGEGAAGSSFVQELRLIHAGGDSRGVSSVHGMRPNRDVMFEDAFTVAVVACASGDLLVSTSDLEKVGDELEAGRVPAVCPGQRTVVPPTQIKASKASDVSYDGAIPFPQIDPKELKCHAGKVAYGDSLP